MNMKTAERGQLSFITRIDFLYWICMKYWIASTYAIFNRDFQLIKIFMINRNSILTQQKQTESIIFIFIIET